MTTFTISTWTVSVLLFSPFLSQRPVKIKEGNIIYLVILTISLREAFSLTHSPFLMLLVRRSINYSWEFFLTILLPLASLRSTYMRTKIMGKSSKVMGLQEELFNYHIFVVPTTFNMRPRISAAFFLYRHPSDWVDNLFLCRDYFSVIIFFKMDLFPANRSGSPL